MSAGADGGSRPSKNNRQGHAQGGERPESADWTTPERLEPSDLPGDTGLRPVSVEPGRVLREEAVNEVTGGPQARPVYAVVNEWRQWYDDYRSMHIEYEGPDGETGRTRLENSYQPRYGKRYYAKLKDLERGIEREYEGLTTVMLTFSASSLNADGLPRCPADHMRDIADGWDTARKQLYQCLSGLNWEYAKVWEPHPGGERSPGGYGHLHVAVFVEADGLEPERFRPVMESYVGATKPAGREAHTVENAVSVNDDVNNLGTYISEYIGAFGDDPLDRPMTEQMFYAVSWATQTRRVDFSNGAHALMKRERFRRETGLEPERVASDAFERWDGGDSPSVEEPESEPSGESERGWQVESICKVTKGEPDYADPTTGGAAVVEIEGRPGVDPPPEVE